MVEHLIYAGILTMGIVSTTLVSSLLMVCIIGVLCLLMVGFCAEVLFV